jgi:hypothetical protein
MCNTGAHLTDRVLPNVAIRQWVLSLPFELRLAAAREPKLVAACDRIFVDAIFRWMRDQLGLIRAKGGAVTAVQRFGSSINLHVHLHVLVLDGVFVRTGRAPPVFIGAPAPTAADLAKILVEVRDGVARWLAKHASATTSTEAAAIEACAGIALQRGLFVDLGGQARRDDDEPTLNGKRKSASLDGFNLHAAVRIAADNDVAREKLVRYVARPAFALERLSVLPDGRIAYAIKNARKGSTHRILTPVELIARLAALIPPPRSPFLRYHGVLAPASKWRKDVVPRVVETAHAGAPPACRGEHADRAHDATPTIAAASSPAPAVATKPARAAKPGAFSPLWQRPANDAAERDPRAITDAHLRRLDGGRLLAATPRLDWGKLLERTYQVDVFTCPRCHGPTRVIAAITEPAVIGKILDHVREPPARAPPSGACEPDDGIDTGDVWLDPAVDVSA